MSERMRIICYQTGFKIRSKADASQCVEIFRKALGDHYFNDGAFDYYADKDGIYKRSMTERGNIFSPYFEIVKLNSADAVDTVWKLRKAINHCIFADDER
ncbi:MAG: hypothetical protein IKE23_01295 [Exiguobacterium sp.]|nr:hypothetical protein [Exiguobacterium sp.]